MTVSSYILETLAAAGVDVAFGLPGVHALGMWNALEDSAMRYVGFRHEHPAAHAADGYGRVTGKPGVVLLSTGPGTLNALSALAEARVSSSPVIAICSSIPTAYVGKQKGYLHETDDLGPAFRAVTRYHGRLEVPEQLPKIMGEAMIAATGTRPGPALIEIPADLFDAELDEAVETASTEPVEPDEGTIDEAALLLGLAARPVIWAGGGVLRSGASAELVRLAESLRAPVVSTFMGKGAFPEDHPLAVGSLLRQPETIALVEKADLVLAVGTRFSAMTTASWKLRVPSQLIQIDIDPQELGRNYPARISIVADAKKALAMLTSSLEKDAKTHRVMRAVAPDEAGKGWAAEAESARDAAFARAKTHGPREMEYLEAIRRAVPPEVVTFHDMTVPSYWAAPFFRTTEPGTFHYPYGYGSLGFSFPASIGAAASRPEAPIVSFSGDGGFQYHSQELATIAQHELPVTALVFNDRSWGVLKAFSRARYGSTFALDLPGPDFVRLAEAHGLPAVRVANPEELESVLSRGLAGMGPSLIEIEGTWELPPPIDYYT